MMMASLHCLITLKNSLCLCCISRVGSVPARFPASPCGNLWPHKPYIAAQPLHWSMVVVAQLQLVLHQVSRNDIYPVLRNPVERRKPCVPRLRAASCAEIHVGPEGVSHHPVPIKKILIPPFLGLLMKSCADFRPLLRLGPKTPRLEQRHTTSL